VLPADTPVKRRVDRLLPRGWPAVAYFAAVIGLLGLAQLLPAPAYLVADAVAFLAGGSWCALNFWRCRQAHCLFTGSGWLLLGLFAAAEAGLGRSLIDGDAQLVFLGVLATGLVFEGFWYLMRRRQHRDARSPWVGVFAGGMAPCGFLNPCPGQPPWLASGYLPIPGPAGDVVKHGQTHPQEDPRRTGRTRRQTRPGSAPGWRDEPGIIQTQRHGRCKFHDINTAPLNRVAGRWRRHAAKEGT
jgi:hypothetical protein